ncbi:hypothetical protein EYF80_051633 [Liparis tanakae]|uniref:Uncharacterized protein n=1 Tax=Liparis tanakae TaxID=230148 RepID=A0A4Z2FBD3_9TELE|nr:hypothetical protein EYF80_051633 [Liparis tanakae]
MLDIILRTDSSSWSLEGDQDQDQDQDQNQDQDLIAIQSNEFNEHQTGTFSRRLERRSGSTGRMNTNSHGGDDADSPSHPKSAGSGGINKRPLAGGWTLAAGRRRSSRATEPGQWQSGIKGNAHQWHRVLEIFGHQADS